MDQNHSHMPILYKMVARKFSSIKWLDHVICGSPTLCIKLAGPCPSSNKIVCKKVQLYKVA